MRGLYIYNILSPTQNKQHRSFTSGVSPLNAASLTNQRSCGFAFLYAKAAFNLVSHPSLLHKLFLDGITDVQWTYYKIPSRMQQQQWSGVTPSLRPSRYIKESGNVLLSTDQYKCYNNPLLDWIQNLSIVRRIGTVACPSPMCSDDVALTASNWEELQDLLDACIYSTIERFQLQPTKSMIITQRHHWNCSKLMIAGPWV